MSRDAFHTSHRVHHPEIEFDRRHEATGTWAMEDVNVDTEYDFYLTGAGFYEDRYVRVDGAVDDRPHRLQAHVRNDHADVEERNEPHGQLVDHRRPVDSGGPVMAARQPRWQTRSRSSPTSTRTAPGARSPCSTTSRPTR